MPSRILREDILTSDRVDQLDFAGEVFYRRLMSKVDDHGLYDGRTSVLKSHLYPLKDSRVREADISRWMAACQKAGLLVLYTHDGKPYLHMVNTRWAARSEPKYPLPPTVNSCAQPETPVLLVVDVVVDESVGVGPRKRGKQPKVSMPAEFGVSERVKAWAAEKGHARLDERLEHFKGKALANGYAYADWDEAFMGAIRDDWAKLVGPPASSRPQTQTPKQAMAPTETKLERAVNWARQQHHNGQIDAAERDRLIAEATAKHRSNG